MEDIDHDESMLTRFEVREMMENKFWGTLASLKEEGVSADHASDLALQLVELLWRI